MGTIQRCPLAFPPFKTIQEVWTNIICKKKNPKYWKSIFENLKTHHLQDITRFKYLKNIQWKNVRDNKNQKRVLRDIKDKFNKWSDSLCWWMWRLFAVKMLILSRCTFKFNIISIIILPDFLWKLKIWFSIYMNM